MRPVHFLILLILILSLSACGSEEALTPPLFSNITAFGPATLTGRGQSITVTGKISDPAADIVIKSTVQGELTRSSDGNWQYIFSPQEGTNTVICTATDQHGNVNQMSFTVLYAPHAPVVTAVTQSLNPSPQLLVTFNNDLTSADLSTAIFTVVKDGLPPLTIAKPFSLSPLAPKSVTLTLSTALLPGSYQLTYSGVADPLSTLNNIIPVNYAFDFTIVE